jgi:hypothetical protein
MHPVFVVAHYTIREIIYKKLLLCAISIYIGCVAIAQAAGQFLIGSYNKILIDATLFSFQIAYWLLILFYVIPFLERQQTYQLYAYFLTKPISRSMFFGGVVGGFFCVLSIVCFVCISFSLIALRYLIGSWLFYIIPAFLTMMMEALILIHISLFFSLCMSNAFAAISTLSFYVIGYTYHEWLSYVSKISGIMALFERFFYYCFPDFRLLDIKNSIMYEVAFDMYQYCFILLYSLMISMIFFLFGQKLFKNKYL